MLLIFQCTCSAITIFSFFPGFRLTTALYRIQQLYLQQSAKPLLPAQDQVPLAWEHRPGRMGDMMDSPMNQSQTFSLGVPVTVLLPFPYNCTTVPSHLICIKDHHWGLYKDPTPLWTGEHDWELMWVCMTAWPGHWNGYDPWTPSRMAPDVPMALLTEVVTVFVYRLG